MKKIILAYLLSTIWFVAYCAAAYYGWVQGVEGVRNVVYMMLALNVMVCIFFLCAGLLCIWSDLNGRKFVRPAQIEHHTSTGWVVWRTLSLSLAFAWVGALFVAIVIPVVVVMSQLARVFFNAAVAEQK